MITPAVLVLPRPRVGARWVLVIGLTLSTGQFGLLFTGMELGVPAGLASLVLQVQAVFTTALAVALLGERPGRPQLAGAVIALGGLAVIAADRAEAVPLGALALVVAAAAAWGAGNVATRVARPPDPLALVAWTALVPPLPLLALSLAVDGPATIADALTGIDARGLLALAYIALVSTAFGYGAWAFLLRRYEASRVAPVTLLVPVVGIASAWVALGEDPSALELLGGLVVLAGLGLTTGAVRGARAVPPGRAAPSTYPPRP